MCVALSGGCAASEKPRKSDADDARESETAPRWIAYGNIGLRPSRGGEPIGVYETRDKCLAAVADWESRQVAGTIVWGECLPEAR